jgi:hypothetical protein
MKRFAALILCLALHHAAYAEPIVIAARAYLDVAAENLVAPAMIFVDAGFAVAT